jgi:hypothetical protein
MNEKFELSLWRDYISSEEVNTYNRDNPGEGVRYITFDELEVGKVYYVWCTYAGTATSNPDYYWRYPASYIYRTAHSANKDYSGINARIKANIHNEYENAQDEDKYDYYFLDQNGELLVTDCFNDGEITIPNRYYKEEKLNILANENMKQFQGKIYNIHLISKIDGTHSLTFEVPQYYIDIFTNKKKKNEYLDLLKMKSKLKLYYRDEWYTFVINTRQEKKNKKYITYNFEATDLVVEELSKTGYSLNFTEDEETIELCGLGNIEELTERVLLNTDWTYDKNLTTANLQEVEEDQILNPLTGLYEDVRTPTMIYKNHYSPCLKKYVYQTEFDYKVDSNNINSIENFYTLDYNVNNILVASNNENCYPIYYTTETQTDCSGTTDNLITTNSDFSSISDWYSENSTILPNRYIDEEGLSQYGLSITKGAIIYTDNFTEKILSSKPYIIRIETKDSINGNYKIELKNSSKVIFSQNNLKFNTSYYIYPNKSISSPEFQITSSAAVVITSVQLFEVAIRNNNNETLDITKDNLGTAKYISANSCQQVTYNIDDTNRGILTNGNYILLPNSIVTATSRPVKKYFIEPYDTIIKVQNAGGDNTISSLDESYLFFIDENDLIEKAQKLKNKDEKNFLVLENGEAAIKYTSEDFSSFSADKIEDNAYDNFINNQSVSYTDEYKNIYYYSVEKVIYKNKEYYLWKNSLLQYADSKRRLVTASKSNRWNILQDIAEKFEVYPKFSILHNPKTGQFIYKDGIPIKKVYFVDRFGELNYSGFKEGINVDSIQRNIISDEIVTKMYVENIEADYTDQGLISIQLSDKNHTKENYIYNFTHYLNTGVLGKSFKDELTFHEANLKSINDLYLTASEELVTLEEELDKSKAYLDTLTTELEESKAKVDEIINEISPVVDYYGIGNYSGSKIPYLTTNDIKNNYGEVYTEIGKVDSNNNSTNIIFSNRNRIFNSSFIINDNYVGVDDKNYTIFTEIDWLYDERGGKVTTNLSNNNNKLENLNITKADATKYFLKNGFKKSQVSDINYILSTQKEFFYLNKNIPFNEEENYYTRKKDGDTYVYTKINNPKEKDIQKYYIRYITSANSEWFVYQKGFFQCNVNSKGERSIRVASNPLFIQNKDTNSFTEWLNKTTFNGNKLSCKINTNFTWRKKREEECISQQDSSTLNSKRDAINNLISGTDGSVNGQTKIISSLYQAKLVYYETLEKYEAKQLFANRLLAEKTDLITKFENKYIQYLKEGYWSGSDYSDNDTYYLDARCAGNDSATPKIEYTLSVIDLSSIPYYKDYKVKIGDETFITDGEMFGYDGNGIPNRERVIISELDEQLDQNSNNKITVKNYSSRFEDLFERLSASVTSVETNEATWSRASIINSDNTINSSLLTTIYGQNSEWINSSIGVRNSYSLDSSGLLLTSEIDPNYQIKITSMGVFLTTTAKSSSKWTTGISAAGINADVINTGILNTNKISIQSDAAPAQIWNDLGISCYSSTGTTDYVTTDTNTFVRLDQFGLYMVNNKSGFDLVDGNPWWYGLTSESALAQIRNNSSVSITRKGFTYQGINGNTNIQIGQFLDKESEGILFKKGNSTIFEVNTNGEAIISGFAFDQNKMWKTPKQYSLAQIYNGGNPSLNNAYNGTIKKNNSTVVDYPFYLGTDGLSMNKIKLEASTGMATFANINLTGGLISGDTINIQKALLGPFKVVGAKDKNGGALSNKEQLEYMYAVYNSSSGHFNYGLNDNNLIPLYNSTYKTYSDTVDNRKNLINRNNKFYLGEFKLSRGIFTSAKINSTIYNSAFPQGKNNTANGILLSVGNVFWVHSAGYGFAGGNFYFNGTLYANKIDTNSISVGGETISGETISQTINNYIKNNKGSIGIKGDAGKNGKDLLMTLFSQKKVRYYNTSNQYKTYDFENVPAIYFQGDDYSLYLVFWKTPASSVPKLGIVYETGNWYEYLELNTIRRNINLK